MEDLDIEAKKQGATPPLLLYVTLDVTELPDETAKNRLAVIAKGRRFGEVCDEIYRGILQLPAVPELVDLTRWDNTRF